MIRWLSSAAKSIGSFLGSGASGSYNPAQWLIDWVWGGPKSAAGVRVNLKSMLSIAAVKQAVTIISGDVAKLPLHVFRNLPEGGRDRTKDHPAWYLLRRKPSTDLTAYPFKQTITAHALLHGNGYAFIARDRRNRPVDLVPMCPRATYPVRMDRRLWYITQVDGEDVRLSPSEVFHLRGLGSDGVMGYAVIDLAKESMGLTLAAQKFGSKFFGNDNTPGGLLEAPGKLTEQKADELRRRWDKMHSADNAHRLAIVEAGYKFTSISVPPEQAQFLETRKFQRTEVASWFNIPSHKLGDDSKTSRNSLAEENQSYLESTLEHWLCSWEEEAWDKLLTEKEKRSDEVFIEFQRLALLRADAGTRSNFYHNALLDGWMNRDEVRDRENLNPIPDGQGKRYYTPLNMDAGDDTLVEDPPAEPGPDPRAKRTLAKLVAETCGRMLRWEVDAAERSAKKPSGYVAAIDDFYGQHADRLAASLATVVECLAAVAGSDVSPETVSRQVAAAHCAEAKQRLLAAADLATDAETLRTQVAGVRDWIATQPAAIADHLITQFFGDDHDGD